MQTKYLGSKLLMFQPLNNGDEKGCFLGDKFSNFGVCRSVTGHQHSELLRRNWLFGYGHCQTLVFWIWFYHKFADHEVLRDYSLREKLKRKAKLGHR